MQCSKYVSAHRPEANNKWPGLITFPAFVTHFNNVADKWFHLAENFSRLISNTDVMTFHWNRSVGSLTCSPCGQWVKLFIESHQVSGLLTGPTHAKLVSLTSPCCSGWPAPMNTLKANNGPLGSVGYAGFNARLKSDLVLIFYFNSTNE